MRSKVIAGGLAAVCVALCPAAAVAQTDYSKNSASGEYVSPAVQAGSHIDYSRNAASGQNLPAGRAPGQSLPARAPAAPADSGFSFGAALAGAALMLLIVGGFAAGRRAARRRPSPAPATSPKLVSR